MNQGGPLGHGPPVTVCIQKAGKPGAPPAWRKEG